MYSCGSQTGPHPQNPYSLEHPSVLSVPHLDAVLPLVPGELVLVHDSRKERDGAVTLLYLDSRSGSMPHIKHLDNICFHHLCGTFVLTVQEPSGSTKKSSLLPHRRESCLRLPVDRPPGVQLESR